MSLMSLVSEARDGVLQRKTASPRLSLWRRLLDRLTPQTVTYRPERYYMRGPGPKYRERHGGQTPRRVE